MRAEVIAWACLSLALIAAEVIAPGVFMLWLGIAAAIVFAIVLLFPGIPILWQALAFIAQGGPVTCNDDPWSLRRVNIHESVTDTDALFLARLVGLF